MGQLKYPLPAFADGELTPHEYSHWVVGESADAYRRDCVKMRPFALKSSQKQCGNVVHEAVIAGNGIDPFTGARLRYDLVHTYDPIKARGNIDYERQFDLMPNVDHIDPEADVLALEICAKRINLCKSEQNPEEFLNMCRKIVEYSEKRVDGCNPQPNLLPFTGEGAFELRGHARFDTSINSVHRTAERKQGPAVDDKNKRPLNLSPPFLPQQGELANGTPFTFPAVYLLPGYLEGRCPQVLFTKWVERTAETRLVRDRKIKRPYAIAAHMLLYKQVIYKAALIGKFDPFTGELLLWELIGQMVWCKGTTPGLRLTKSTR
jgi:hypothetical protein